MDKILQRANLQHIAVFLLHGAELRKEEEGSYAERVSRAEKALNLTIREKVGEGEAYEKITEAMAESMFSIETVYMEIGIQCGMALARAIG